MIFSGGIYTPSRESLAYNFLFCKDLYMEEVMKSLQHKRDGQGEVVLDWVEEDAFSYLDENQLII